MSSISVMTLHKKKQRYNFIIIYNIYIIYNNKKYSYITKKMQKSKKQKTEIDDIDDVDDDNFHMPLQKSNMPRQK